MEEEQTIVAASDLRELAQRILSKAGFAPDDSRLIAEVLVWADLRGHESHGVARLKRYLVFVDRGDLDPRGRPAIRRDLGALIQIDGHRSAGAVALSAATDHAMRAARQLGAAWVLVGQTTHAGAAGYFADRIARRGLIGMVFAAGPPLMAYHGSAGPVVSTSPLAIAIPRSDKAPFLLDMATSVAAHGKIRQALQVDRAIPEGWALDSQGVPTTNPADATCMLPVGGPKGSGLALAFEMICSLGANVPILQSALVQQTPHIQNAAVCAIDIAQLTDIEDYKLSVSDLADLIRAQPRMAGVDELLLPGERGERMAIERESQGIPVDAALLKELLALG